MGKKLTHFIDPFGAGVGYGHGLLQGNTLDPTSSLFGKDNSQNPATATAQLPTSPVATPPISPTSQPVVAAEQSQLRQQARRKSINSTIYAGATGGWNGGAQMAQGPSVSSGGAMRTG